MPNGYGRIADFLGHLARELDLWADAWLSLLVNPGVATDAIQAAIAGGARAEALPDGLLLKAWISVGLWTLVALAGALAWSRKQDLSKE